MTKREDTTLNAILTSYEDDQDDSRRPHLGGSIIGRPCSRELWYSFRWCTNKRHSGRVLRLFQTGHLAEARFTADLRSAGVTVYDTNPATGDQFKASACDGHFGGSFDGVGVGFLEAPEIWHLIEMKTHNEKSFKKLAADGVAVAKPEHYVQMQVYMYLAEPRLQRAFYLAVNKNTDELYAERIRLNPDVGRGAVEKASVIIASDRPLERLSNDPSWYQCKFCDHHNLCHGNDAPEVNCRTCMHSTPAANSEWHCSRHDMTLNLATQKVGCDDHLYNPYLLDQFAEPLDSGDFWIRYRLKSNGKEVVTGRDDDHFSSSEIRVAQNSDLLTDENFLGIKDQFDGKILAN